MNIAGGWYTTASLGEMLARLRAKEASQIVAADQEAAAKRLAERGQAMLTDQGISILQGFSRARATLDQSGMYNVWIRRDGEWLHVGLGLMLEEAAALDDGWYWHELREFERSRM